MGSSCRPAPTSRFTPIRRRSGSSCATHARSSTPMPGAVSTGKWGAVMFRGAFRRAMNRGVFVPLPLNALAMIVTGALAEACLLIADAEDPAKASTEALSVVFQLLEGLRPNE